MSVHYIQEATRKHPFTQTEGHIIESGPSNRNEVCQEMRPYWIFSGELAIIAGIAMIGKRGIIPGELQQQMLEKTRLLT